MEGEGYIVVIIKNIERDRDSGGSGLTQDDVLTVTMKVRLKYNTKTIVRVTGIAFFLA